MSARLIVCANCGGPWRHAARGLCAACYQYAWRHGAARPARLYAPEPACCRNCAQPIGFWEGGHGRCGACRRYWYVTGRERPVDPAERAARGLRPLVPIPVGRPKAPARGWHWTADGWAPPQRYCEYGREYGQRALCSRCGLAGGCEELTALAAQRRMG